MRTTGKVTISDAHCEAIRKEIGYRLHRELGNDHLNIPNWMSDLVKRLDEVSCVDSPSISPNDLVPITTEDENDRMKSNRVLAESAR
jgi:hypothetical protein